MNEAEGRLLHVPVLLQEVLQNLPTPLNTVIDLTLGLGGHSSAILAAMPQGSRLIGMDKDQSALDYAGKLLYPQAEAAGVELTLVKNDFAALGQWALTQPSLQAQFILADIGVSSPQIDLPERGFSYRLAGPLDMRMDQSRGQSAAEVLATLSSEQLADIIHIYGEERYSRRIAAKIVAYREKRAITDTLTLADIVRSAVPKAALKEKQDPARRTFQALRIYVNDELTALQEMLQAAVNLLAPGGRLAVISFHSLEDRIVKRQFHAFAHPCTCLPDLPCCCGRQPAGRVLTPKPLTASAAECEANFRAHSAKLRIFEKM